MGCCGSSNETVKYRFTDPQGVVHIYLSEPEYRIAVTKYGGGTVDIIREKKS